MYMIVYKNGALFCRMSLLVMIFVNYAGYNSYYFFAHVTWDGLYIADLVFPWFVWIMGTSMIFSMRGMRKRNTPTKVIVWRICKRSFWLFAIGIFLGSSYGGSVNTTCIFSLILLHVLCVSS